MPEIIKRGTPKPEPTYQVTCDGCDSVIRFKKSELTRDCDGIMLAMTALCPVCGKLILVSKTAASDEYPWLLGPHSTPKITLQDAPELEHSPHRIMSTRVHDRG